ncbi:MAG: synthase [Verrucomicrobiaceae bacterium]|nr:synthase [Verrucomicrobiaceae bacterium]
MQLKIVMAQLNPLVGDIDGNAQKVLVAIEQAQQQGADVLVFPELMLTGYPPEDLLLRPSIKPRVDRSLARICAAVGDIYVVVGYPRLRAEGLFNCAGVIHRGMLIAEYDKQELPNYRVFDEKRYFVAGIQATVVNIRGVPVGISVCEDIWQLAPIQRAKTAGARLLLNLNASPFHVGKQHEREQLLQTRAREGDMPIVYVNLVGGQDELIFDGGSLVVDAQGDAQFIAPSFEEGLFAVDVAWDGQQCTIARSESPAPLARVESVYRALVLGVRDYVNKNRFNGVVLGLSGGIDSALTLAIAVDALGADRVEAVMMPFRYTAQISIDDAADEARRLGVNYRSIPIEAIYNSLIEALAPEFENRPLDKTEENIQARCRGVLLMAISNKKGSMVLTTGNKSEMAVGYSTLYGDMAGGLDVLKDVPKTLVFELSNYRNTIAPVIPQRVIDRPPSAELAPDQKDQDTLPPYDELDRILELYVEHDYSLDAIVAEGFERDVVARVIRMVDLNEYKRRQSPVGIRISQRGFGRDRRYPITSGWKAGD